MVRRNTAPSTADLVDFLTDSRAVAERFGSSPGALFAAYARKMSETDPGIAAQLREAGSVAPGAVRPGSALAALDMADAPGARLNGKAGYGSWGELARHAAVAELRNAWTETVPSEGGFTVAETLRSDMLRWSLESSVMRPGATVIPVTETEQRTLLPVVDDVTHDLDPAAVLGGVSWAWTAEGADIAASAPTFGRAGYEARKLAGLIGPVPNETVSDGAAALDVFFRQVAPKGYAWAEDGAFISGSSVAEPEGYLSARGALTQARAGDSHIAFTDVVNLVAQMLPQSLSAAVFIASQTALTDMLSLYQGTLGAVPPSMWVSSDGAGGWTLLGRPLLISEKAPALGTRGDLTFIDRSFYVIADRREFTIAESAKGPGFQDDATYWRLTARLDGRLWITHPVTSAAGTQVSPCVVLGDTA